MTTIGKEIVQTLKKHLHCSGSHCFHRGDSGYDQLVTALAALYPSQEPEKRFPESSLALHAQCQRDQNKLYGELTELRNKMIQSKKPDRKALIKLLNKLKILFSEEELDAFCAWAEGMEAKPSWCSHLKWMKQTATMAAAHISEGWVFNESENVLLSVDTNRWAVCPICSAPRPAGKER